MKISPKKLKDLKTRLPYGYGKMLKEKTGCSISHVSMVINGKVYDHKGIINAALDLAEAEDERKKKTLDRL